MQFTKKDTAVVKGVAILMMLFHHCFESAGRYEGFTLNFFPLTEAQTITIASFFKICVPVFVFLSGFGITFSLSRINNDDPSAVIKQVRRRTFSLMSGFWIIYIMSVISMAIIMPASLVKAYGDAHLINTGLFALFDFLGLSELFGTPTLVGTWWYMSLALIIIALMPIIYKVYKRFGAITVLVATFLINGIIKNASSDDIVNFDMIRYLFILELGMICADKNILGKIKDFKPFKRCAPLDFIVKFIILAGAVVFCIYERRYTDWTVSYVRDGIMPFIVILFSYIILSEIPIIRNILQFLGKHSMNIFMSHTLLRGYFLKNFLYGLKYSMLTFFVLLGLSVLLSIFIDIVKKYTGYNKLCEKIMQKIS